MIRSLAFQNNQVEATMIFYVALFHNSKIIKIKRWTLGGPVEEGKIMQTLFDLNGNRFMCTDNPPVHDWNFLLPFLTI